MEKQIRNLIRDAMMFAVKDITGRVLREATVQSMIDDFNKTINYTQSSLPCDAKEYHEKQLKLLGIANVVGQSEKLNAFVDWWHNLSQEELVWYEGRYVEVFLSL